MLNKSSIKYKLNFIPVCVMLFSLLSGCAREGEKSSNLTVLYAVALLLSVMLLMTYCLMAHKKEGWFLLLFGSIIVVNAGYLALALAKTLDTALWANRISYLGSVFLPLAMFMIIMKVCRLGYPKWLAILLAVISIFVFFVAASPGYSDIYYKEVTFESVHGVGVLNKVYGIWHDLYLVYLLGYFGSMVALILYSGWKKTAESQLYATILGGAVFVNIGVWLLEQFIHIDFEILSVSYIITEFFLLGICIMMQENERIKALQPVNEPQQGELLKEEPETMVDKEMLEKKSYVEEHLYLLTKTERRVYDFYMADKSTKEILKEMNITENTLKYHNRNIYGKLGVSSRKQLKEIGKQL